MEYPFKDLLPLDEVLAREGYYKDWTHLDPEVFYSLTQISNFIKTKGYGVDVRLLIAQLAEHFGLKTAQVVDLANLLQQKFTNLEGVTQSFTNNINSLVAQMEADKNTIVANATVDSEVILARGGMPTLQARLDETTAQLAQKAEQSDIDDTNSEIENISTELDAKLPRIPSHLLAKMKNKVNFPDGWTWADAPINIYQSGDGTITTDFEASHFEYVGAGKTYYLSKSGNTTNDGLTLETAISSLNIILNKGDADIILVDDGYYDFSNGSGQVDIGKSITIKAMNGDNADVTISTNATLNFSLTSGYTNVYNASRSGVGHVYDGEVLNDGDLTKLTLQSSIADVDDNVGSYYIDGSALYIHTLNSRVPDDKIKVFLNLYNLRNTGDYTTYTENIKWHGGNHGSAYIALDSSVQNPLFVAKNCEFKYSNDGDGGLEAKGCDVYLQNCIASSNYQDGFNYHIYHNRINKVIEVDCKGYLNGLGRGSWQDNGSTMHDGGKIIRVNGEYYKNEGPNVHDVSTGTQSWNVGGEASKSLAGIEPRNVNYQIEQGEMWLDTCIGYDSERAYHVPNNGILNLRNCLFDDGLKSVTTGTKNEY